MSSIALTPNALGTGTLTVAAPNTNTARTITLPDLTGTAVVNQGSVPFSIDSLGAGVGGGTSSIFKLYVTGSIGSSESITIGTSGTYLPGSIYSDANWGMIFRAKQASPGQAEFMWNNAGGTERMRIDVSGGLILAGSTAQKATGTTWSNPSDQRLKTNIMDYPKGITELMQVRVREWEYNGKGGTTAGMAGLGVIADEVMTVLPNTVDTYDAKLNEADEETTAIKKFDATEITWLLVKGMQEQQAMITALEARIAVLEAK